MKLTSLRPILWTNKFDETIEFYTKILRFTCSNHDDSGWASLTRDDVEIMIAQPNEHAPFERPGLTGSFYFNTDEVDELWEEIKDKAEVVYGIESFEWQMREFAILDNNGYMLQFGQDISLKK